MTTYFGISIGISSGVQGNCCGKGIRRKNLRDGGFEMCRLIPLRALRRMMEQVFAKG